MALFTVSNENQPPKKPYRAENVIEQFYREKSQELVRLCRAMLYMRGLVDVDPEDIVQKVVLRAWEKRQKLAKHPNLMGWFVDACKKECNALLRRRKCQRRKLGLSVPFADELLLDRQQDIILRWLNEMEAKEILDELAGQLTPLEKRVFELYYAQDMTARETAEVLHEKANTVNDAARRIRKKALKIYQGLLLMSKRQIGPHLPHIPSPPD